jgi:hypothetical protein
MMDAELSVELGADDPTLAVPWSTPDGVVAYVDLKRNPAAVDTLEEVVNFPELGPFLLRLNLPDSIFETAKCDAWIETLMDVDDEPYEATVKCGSYVDVFFREPHRLFPFAEQEHRAQNLVKRLRKTEDRRARAEITLRRAYFGDDQGFYWTIYLYGYGDEIAGARSEWARALEILLTAMLQ